jgi:hypothetical protein
MNGLRYYIGSLIICAASTHAAQDYKEPFSPKLKIHVILPAKTGSKLQTSSRTFRIAVNSAVTIAALKEIFEQEILTLARQTPTCSCGGPCADIRAAQALMSHKDKAQTLQITHLGKTPEESASLHSLGVNVKDDTLYAKY